MDEKTNWQSLEKNGPITEYNEPFIEQRADPFVCKAADGTYYFTASYPAYDRILLRIILLHPTRLMTVFYFEAARL